MHPRNSRSPKEGPREYQQVEDLLIGRPLIANWRALSRARFGLFAFLDPPSPSLLPSLMI